MIVHFIGICGTAMATLAALYTRRGHAVQGSDAHVYPPMSDFLAAEGIPVFDGFRAEHITPDVDLVIVGNAISRGNAELEAVLDRKQRYCSLPEAIRDQFLWDRRAVVIAGTHGKTTTTSLVASVLTDAGRDPSALIGGISANLGSKSYRLGAGDEFVIEGDEYDSAYFDKTAKFLKYLPDIAVVGNVEFDHADIYPDLDAILLAFRRFLALVPRNGLTVLGIDSEHVLSLRAHVKSRVVTVGLAPEADWRARDVRSAGGLTVFEVDHAAQPWATVETTLLGLHNVRNILATIAVAADLGVAPGAIVAGVRAFRGVKRRMELRGEAGGVKVYDDFAHHPTAIRETLAGVRAAHPAARIWGIFEPRSATSCRRVFQDEFATAFDAADEAVLAAVFRANLPDDQRLSGEAVVAGVNARGGHARLIPTVAEIVATVAGEARDGDLVVVMSNGGFDGIHDKLIAALRARGAVTRWR